MQKEIDPRLNCVATKLKEAKQALSDAEWVGDELTASLAQLDITYYQELIEQGVLYEPKF